MNELIKKILEWGVEKGITGPDGKGTRIAQAAKVLEEARETYSAVQVGDLHETKDGIGDTMVTCILLAEMHGWTAEGCLQAAYDVISKRTGKMVDGSFHKDSEPEAPCAFGVVNCGSCS